MLTCEEIKEKLVEFLDGELPNEASLIQEHTKVCPKCQEELNSLSKLKKLFRTWRDIRPSREWKVALEKKLSRIAQEPGLETIEKVIFDLNERLKVVEQALNSIQSKATCEIMTLDELSRYLKLRPEDILTMVDQIPNIQIGSEYRFIKESIDRWLRSLENSPYADSYSWCFDSHDEQFRRTTL